MNRIAQVPPKHVQIRDQLAGRISRGELIRGAKLPTVRAIAGEFGVSATVAGDAVKLLAAEKQVKVLGRRRGTIVTGPEDRAEVLAPRLVFGPQERLGWAGDIPGEHAEVITRRPGEQDRDDAEDLTGMADARGGYAYIAAILHLEAAPRHGTVPVWRRTQLIRDPAGTPVRLEVSWFRAAWAEQVTDEHGGHPLADAAVPLPSFGGAAWLIARHTGRPVVAGAHGVETRSARNDGRETVLLGLEPEAPLLAGVYDWQAADPATGELQIIEYGEYCELPGRVVQFRYAVTTAAPGVAD